MYNEIVTLNERIQRHEMEIQIEKETPKKITNNVLVELFSSYSLMNNRLAALY